MELKVNMGFLKPFGNFFKKYVALLPSIGITVAALLLFLPTMMLGSKVKKAMATSAGVESQVSSQLRKVPSKDEPMQVKQYMDQLEAEATEIETLAIQSSQRELVSYDIFPEPTDSSSQLFTEYGTKYRARIEALVQSMNALDAPSDAEIRSKTGTGGVQRTRGRVRTEVNTQDPMINALCMTRAGEISVYANPEVFTWYDFWGDGYTFEGQSKALEDCWDSQVALWVYEDVVDVVRKMNGTEGQVSSSPVKRLLGVSFSGPIATEGVSNNRFRRAAVIGMRDKPMYVQDMMPSPFMQVSTTRRMGDDEVDVVHFAVSVLVDNRYAMAFMKELCSEKQHVFLPDFSVNAEPVTSKHNQITILQSDLSVVDKQAEEHELYRYGKGAVVRLDLVCEYLFNRKGYDRIKPAPIKTQLRQEDESEEGGNNQPGNMGLMNMPR